MTYNEGENFDPSGMVVEAIYDSLTTPSVILSNSSYSIEDGNNLKANQKSVKITYNGKSVELPITVNSKTTNNTPNINTDIDTDKNNTGSSNNTQNYVAQNSNLSNLKCVIKSFKAHYYNENDQQAIMTVQIDGLTKNVNNDKLEYFYYISSNKNEQNITKWSKITDESNNDNSLQFTIDLLKLPNYNELFTDGNLYIYIKEVAIKGSTQNEAVSNAMELILADNIKIDKDSATLNNSNGKNPENVNTDNNPTLDNLDDTISPNKMPFTGIFKSIVIIMLIISLTSIYVYIRYKNLSKYIK